MAVNEEQRQVAIAREIAELARTLAHSTRDIPRPSDSYALLGELSAAQRSLAQVYEQLAVWHGQVRTGLHHDGDDPSAGTEAYGIGGAANRAASLLREAGERAALAEDSLREAHSANGVVRWFDSTDPTDE